MCPIKQTSIEGGRRAHSKVIQSVGDGRCRPGQTVGAGSDAIVERKKENSVAVTVKTVMPRIGPRIEIEGSGVYSCPICAFVRTGHQGSSSPVSANEKSAVAITYLSKILGNRGGSFNPVRSIDPVPDLTHGTRNKVGSVTIACVVDPITHICRIGHGPPVQAIITDGHTG